MLNSFQIGNPMPNPDLSLRAEKSNFESSSVKKGDGTQKKDTEFRDTLRKLTSEKPGEKEDKQVSPDEISKKVENLEKKIEVLSKSDQENDIPVEELKAMLEKIKSLMNAFKEGNKKETPSGNQSMDTLALLNSLLDKIAAMLANQNGNNKVKELDSILKRMEQTVDEAARGLQASGKISRTPAELSVQKELLDQKNNETAPKPSEKVTVSDERTVSGKDNKEQETKTVKPQTAFKEELKNITKGETPKNEKEVSTETAVKTQNTDLSEAIKLKEAVSPAAQKFEVGAKQPTGAVPTVTKASMEALMHNIAGNAFVTLKDGKSEMKMTLTPPELGRMNLKFSLEDGQMMGKIVVSTPEAKALFDQNLGDLQRALQQAGIMVSSLDVNLGSGGNSQEQQNLFDGNNGFSNGISNFEEIGTADSVNNSYYTGGGLFESRINFVA